MSTNSIPFDEEHKTLVLDYDFEYFIKFDLEENNYSDQQISELYAGYHKTLKELQVKLKENKKQFLLYLDGQVRLMFDGGFIGGHFRIDGFTRKINILDFKGTGQDWAYFELWQKYERRKRNRKNAWDITVKVGAVLAIGLTALRIIEAITKM